MAFIHPNHWGLAYGDGCLQGDGQLGQVVRIVGLVLFIGGKTDGTGPEPAFQTEICRRYSTCRAASTVTDLCRFQFVIFLKPNMVSMFFIIPILIPAFPPFPKTHSIQ